MRFLLLPTFLLTGCAAWQMSRPVDDLSIRTPGSWAAVSGGAEARISTGWLDTFTDAGLKNSVNEALTYNRDLMAASARLREATQNSIIAQARSFPEINVSGGGSATDSNNAPVRESYSLNLSAAWEPDLWGRLRDLNRASSSDYRAALEDYRGARLSLAANTAKAWCNLISAQQEVDLAGVTLSAYEKSLRIIERNYKSTGEGALDVRFARTNVSSAMRDVESRKLALNEAARSLELLLGRYPAGSTRAAKDLPRLTANVPSGLPADLLERRPDLAAGRARLLASATRADASRKALLPSFSLTGSGGAPSDRLARLLDAQELFASISARISQTLFDAGLEKAAAEAALARNEAAVHEYAQKSLVAFREVEAALAADRSLATQENYLTAELEQSTLAEKQAERNYSQGVNPNILSVLEAQRRANGARASMIRLRNQRLQNRINLHLALGGDFSSRSQ